MEIIGESGELVERLVEAVNSNDWQELSWILVFAVGGEPTRVDPDTGHNYPAGSVGAERRKTHRVVSRDEYFKLIGARLTEVVRFGLREDVLVRGLRDEITRQMRSFADMEQGHERRAETKANLERRAADPDFIARFREEMATKDPTIAAMSDQQIAENFLSMAERLAPVPLERELDLWATVDRWVSRADDLISDAVIDQWLDRFVERVTREQ